MSETRSELRLLASVLARAVADFHRIGPVLYHEHIAAIRWIKKWKPHDAKRPFTFPWVCEHLDLDPEILQQTILSIKVEDSYNRVGSVSASFIEKIFDPTHGTYKVTLDKANH